MTPEEYINSAPNNEVRNFRKIQMFGAMYGTSLPLLPADSTTEVEYSKLQETVSNLLNKLKNL